MKIHFLFFVITLSATILLSGGCKNAANKAEEGMNTASANDTALLEPVTINNLFLDSNQLHDFISSHPEFRKQSSQLHKFYSRHHYQYAWFNNSGLSEQASNFMNMLVHYQDEGISDSSIYSEKLQQLYDVIENGSYQLNGPDSINRSAELFLSAEFFKYAQQIWGGIGEEQYKDIAWYIKRKRLPYVTMLDSMLSNPVFFKVQKVVYRQYDLLKDYLKKYRRIEMLYPTTTLVADKKTYRPGDSSEVISQIRTRLFFLGDLAVADTTKKIFDSALVSAVKNFQQRNGLKIDGIIGSSMINALNVPIAKRLQQIMINMERSRWVPVELKGNYLTVNIPEYQLHVYENDSLAWNCNVVVGSTSHQTVIFNGDMKYIVFSPYWNIPKSIVINETLPAEKKNRSYIGKHNMEVVSGSKVIEPSDIEWEKYSGKDFPYSIRQKPGPNNSLGRVKFLFPNNYAIYLHDTPAKSLFEENSRAFSHGCIRVGEPMRLAEYLLRNDAEWTPEKIEEAMNNGQEKTVTLNPQIPVFIAYFTSWVDRTGKINFRDDIYGHDARLGETLFTDAAINP